MLIDARRRSSSRRSRRSSPAQLEAQILLADQEVRRLGLTMVHDAGTNGETVDAYKRLIDAGRLKTRLYVMLRGSLPTLTPFFQTRPGDRLRQPSPGGARHQDPGGRRARLARRRAAGAVLRRAGHERIADDAARGDLRADAGRLEGGIPDRHSRDRRSRQPHRDGHVRARAARGARRSRSADAQRARADPRRGGDSAVCRAARHRLDAGDARDVGHAVGAGAHRARADGGGRLRLAEAAQVGRRCSPTGSDFPVEEPNPMLGFYAAITRQDRSGNPPGGWIPDQRLSRARGAASPSRGMRPMRRTPRRSSGRSKPASSRTSSCCRKTSCACRRRRFSPPRFG